MSTRSNEVDVLLGAAIAAERRARGWTVLKLAQAADLPPFGVARCEAGNRLILASEVFALTRALGISPLRLFSACYEAANERSQDERG